MASEKDVHGKIELSKEMIAHFSNNWSYDRCRNIVGTIGGLTNWMRASCLQVYKTFNTVCSSILLHKEYRVGSEGDDGVIVGLNQGKT